MQEEIGHVNRRTFLRLGGAALATAGTSRVWSQSSPDSSDLPLTTREEPKDPVIIQSEDLSLVLDRHHGLPYRYNFVRSLAYMLGEDLGQPITATFCDKAKWQFNTVPITVFKASAQRNRADFVFHLNDGTQTVAEVTLSYAVAGATVHIIMGGIREMEGYQLIDVNLPRLVSIASKDSPTAWLAHGDDGGWLAAVKDANPGSLKPNTFWGNVLATMPIVMIGDNQVLCVQETTAFMDGTSLAGYGETGKRRAAMGTTKVHRVNGSLCYDMNTGTGKPRNCGNKQTPNLLVEQPSTCRLDFLAAANGQPLTWLDGARLARARMPQIPNHLYDNAFVYGIRCDEPSFPQPSATFSQCEQLIRQIAELTDYSPQIVHLWGWQYRGKDTGYPAVAEVDQRIGGYDAMMNLLEKAHSYNCIATISDNYDDAYRSSPAWDPKIIARRPDGELWESRNWTGENSYIIGPAKYMAGPGMERVRYTCERYKLPKTTHVDVLSYFSIRNDWDAEHPASGIKNLTEGRYKILQEFAKRGVDVSSEALRYAFIGKISSFWYMTGPSSCPFGGTPIPLLPAIYRKSAIWGQSGRSTDIADRVMKMLFYNGCAHAIVRADTTLDDAMDTFYLVMVPWFQLHGRNIESFRREGERTIIGLEGNALIDIDWGAKTYSASVAGAPILGDSSTFCPLGDDRVAVYSVTPKQLAAALPAGWSPSDIRAAKLSQNGSQDFRPTVETGKIVVTVEARQPIMIYRDDAAKRRSRTKVGKI
jgi:Endo-alpha-N-acetylgalactosaminidase